MPLLIAWIVEKAGTISTSVLQAAASLFQGLAPLIIKAIYSLIKLSVFIWSINIFFSLFPMQILQALVYHMQIFLFLTLGWFLHTSVLAAVLGVAYLYVATKLYDIIFSILGIAGSKVFHFGSRLTK